jgi:pyruvate dehydrogenase E1 component alpha subunit
MPTLRADGQDVVAVHGITQQAQQHVRGGKGPFFVEYQTYRYRAHSMFDAELYRDKREVEAWRARGPLHTFSARLKAEGKLTEEEFLALDREAAAEVDRAVAFAEGGTWEPVEDLTRDVVAEKEFEGT